MNNPQQPFSFSPQQQQFAFKIRKEVEQSVQALQQGRLDEAIHGLQTTLNSHKPDVQGYDLVTHNLLVACKRKIEQMLAAGDHAATTPYINLVLGLQPRGQLASDRDFRSGFADSLHGLGVCYADHFLFEAASLCFRKAISISPCPTYHNDLSFALSAIGLPGKLTDYAPAMESKQLGQHMFIACMPKSGSTFLKNVLCKITGHKDCFFFHAHGQNEHDLYLPTVLKFSMKNTVTQQHSRASHANVQMMQAFDIKPVVLVRNVFDVVISQLDFYKGPARINTYHQGGFENLDDEQKIDLLIDYFVPWHLQFHASWLDAEARQRLPVFWLTYETLIADKPYAVEQVLEFYGLKYSRDNIAKTIDSVEADSRKNLFNKGIAGRGQAGLSEAQKERIRSMTRHYPSVDFSLIGL
jgi:hypothetical protein